MDVNGINNNGINPLNNSNKSNKVSQQSAQNQPKKSTDKIEISKEAKILQSQSKDLSVIKERVNNNFYNREDVINKVADSILKEIKGNS